MNRLLLAGTILVNLALLAYATAIVGQFRTHRVSASVARFILLGVILDGVATLFMIAGSRNSPFTLHGILGYIALGLMASDTFLLRRHRVRWGESSLPLGLHRYSLAAFGWWVVTYLVGAALVMGKS